jgi:hypothetical protein
VNVKYFKLLKKNQVQGEGNSFCTRNNVAGAVADVVLPSVEKMISILRFVLVIAVRHAIITMMMMECTMTKKILKK